jgi:lipopolysaccharide biosynthesis glycosyltransferase
MNILLCSDNTYAPHLAATIASVLSNNSNVNFYIFTTDFSLTNKELLKNFVLKKGARISFVYVDESLLKGLPMSVEASKHISIETYLRLFAELLLPKSVDKLIYLDSDIIVRDSLLELWNYNIDEYALAAVYQYNEWSYNNGTFSRLNYDQSYGYFNAGVLLINLVFWRKRNVTTRLFSFINGNYNSIISHDQDTLNAVLHKETAPLKCKWNVLPFFLGDQVYSYTFPNFVDYYNEIEDIKGDPSILHFVFKPKPWQFGCNHIWKEEYFKYLDLTPWRGERPEFIFRSFVNYIFIPTVIRLLKKIKNVISFK